MGGTGALKRDHSIDIIRGFWIVSMTFSHLASGTLLERMLHLPPWVDGASGFVLMSGLVLGMVQPWRIERRKLSGATTAILRRAVVLYTLHVAAVALALLAAHLNPAALWLPKFDEEGSGLMTILRLLSLQINPQHIDILSMYVILLLLAAGAGWCLHKGRLKLLGSLSLATYIVSNVHPAWTTLPASIDTPGFFNWGAWQLLFITAFIVGWYWRQRKLYALLASNKVVGVTAVSALLLVIGGLVMMEFGQPTILSMAEGFFEKGTAGMGRILLAWAAFILLYRMVGAAVRALGTFWFAPLEKIGRQSLDSFVILSILTICFPVLLGTDITQAAATATAFTALASMWLWSFVKSLSTRHRSMKASKVGHS